MFPEISYRPRALLLTARRQLMTSAVGAVQTAPSGRKDA